MKTNLENGKLTFFLEGRIDATNAPEKEQEIFSVLDAENGNYAELEVDAKDLEYISSAGLRVLMKMRKTYGKKLPMVNVSRDVYDILETTKFTEILDVKKAMRQVSVEGCEVIGKGGHGKVYRLDAETIIKVYHDASTLDIIEKEMKYAKNAFVNGVPSAISYDIVNTEEGYGLVYEMAGADTVGKTIMAHPDRLQELMVKMAKLLKILNTTEADSNLFGDIRQTYLDRAKNAEKFYTPEENEQIRKLINAIPDGTGMVHGDYHPNNVMVQADGELALIDMADISRGNGLFDIGGAFLTMYLSGMRDPSITQRFTGLEYEMSKQAWGILLSTYYGTTDPQQLDLIGKRCAAFALTRMATTIGVQTEASQAAAEGIVALLREQLFPNFDGFMGLLGMEM